MAKDVKFDVRAQNKTDTAFNAVDRNLKKVSGGISSMKGALLGIGATVGGLYAVGKGVEAVTKAAMVQREAETKLNSVLEATGHAAGFSLDQLKKMASGFQELTTVGDETILSGQAILATFKNIRGEAFERATMAALDMSQVMGQDLKSSMVQLGKALNDPVKGLTALSRVGVTFTEQQKEQIKTLQESGDIFGAQNIILQELESQFGGAAEAAGGPFDKAIKQLKNTFSDLLEEIGFGITENEAFVKFLQIAKDYIAGLIPVAGELIKKFVAWIGPVDHLRGKLDMFLRTVKAMLKPLEYALKFLKGVGSIIGTGSAMIYTAGESLLQGRLPSFQSGTGPGGLPANGLFYGHKGEIVLNPIQSAAARQGAGAGRQLHFHLHTLAADQGTIRNAAATFYREFKALEARRDV